MKFSVFFEPYRVFKKVRIFLENIMGCFPYFRIFLKTRNTEYPVTLKIWFLQKVIGINGEAYWPMHHSSQVSFSNKVVLGKNVLPGYQFGCYVHGVNGVIIGDYTYIAPNVGIQSGNHQATDLRNQVKSNPIIIGKYCWLGMGVVILPNVELGDFTIVGAGSVVTKSFKDGYCIIVGNPAKKIRDIDKLECILYENKVEYIGYIPINQYKRMNYLNNILQCAE